MPTRIELSQDFVDDFEQSATDAMQNLASMCSIEMKKLAPYARPSQYKPRKYKNSVTGSETGGSLARSIVRGGSGMRPTIVSAMPYAIMRNYVNKLNPQTKLYIERGIKNVLQGKQEQWWQAQKIQGR